MNYKGLGYLIPYFWMPRFINAKDSSARTLDVYNDIISNTSTKTKGFSSAL